MDLFRQWIIRILSVIIFVTFVDIILPNSNYRRYINVVVGLLVMLIILKPLMGLMSEGMALGDGILKNNNEIQLKTTQNRVNNLQLNNNESIIMLYKNNLKSQMQNRIEKQLGFKVHDIHLEIEEENDNFGAINGLTIILDENKEEQYLNEEIEEVEVNVSISEDSNKFKSNSIMLGNEGEEIKKDFSSFYEISEEKISISVLKNN
ncbi:stage III sporulation protein AF [Alkaliphilus pronyensis]|uniref:Stage III sporulation protein AF n=1 Tax=Alkaliphilus pronyensis TaxID=1482732 RepID=A0A6I0FE82_9FIRM|nr:stage III sporulation protein AF [Alkaliphilus pronyensis]KAB3537379.1 stage III sporulation protein AF [Alkaliphilus pronyensis]